MNSDASPSLRFLSRSGDNIVPLVVSHPVLTDLTVSTEELDPRIWHRVQKDLRLHTSKQSLWLHLVLRSEKELAADDLVVTDIRIGGPESDSAWESRPNGISISRSKFRGKIDEAITDLEVLFGTDAVDPRPQWTLLREPLRTDARPDARLSILCGRIKPSEIRPPLRAGTDGRFKIVQISDTHMVTGVGACKDAINADGELLPESVADPLTVNFVSQILDIENPDLVILAGDQLHHDIPDSQSALFKVLAPIIERSIPFAAVFGNHDSEGEHALARTSQMSILRSLPFSLCEPGSQEVDGVGNYYLRIFAPAPSQQVSSIIYLLDSHGTDRKKLVGVEYEPIKQSQIDWFVQTSRVQRRDCSNSLSLAFFHIPLPEFGDPSLEIQSGQRRERTEAPRVNSHFYAALEQEEVSVISCGHDHANDFCALLPHRGQQADHSSRRAGPWLCHGGGSGFGGYGSYGGRYFHRRMRVYELHFESLKTWLRVEYNADRIDELVLVADGNSGRDPQGE